MDQCFEFVFVASRMEVDFRNSRREELEETKHKVEGNVAAVVHAKNKII